MSLLPAPPKSHSEIKATRRMRWWYEQLADYMMAHPQARQNDIATYFGRSASTISVIINSDAFQNYLRSRRANHTAALDQSVRTKMLDVADKGFDLILDRFEKKKDSIPLDMLVKTTEMVLKASQPQSGPSTVVHVGTPQPNVTVAVGLDDLMAAREALRNAQRMTPLPEPVEGEFTEVPAADPLDDLA